jgi:hypothetical protein
MLPDLATQREQSEEALLKTLQKRGYGVKIDGTININTLVTAGTILVSGALAYAALDKRITILEQLASERTVRVEKQLEEIKMDIKNITAIIHQNQTPKPARN